MDAMVWRSGRDPQLERAVEVVLEQLRKSPPPAKKKPAYPNYYNQAGAPARPSRPVAVGQR
jgi:tricorn protease